MWWDDPPPPLATVCGGEGGGMVGESAVDNIHMSTMSKRKLGPLRLLLTMMVVYHLLPPHPVAGFRHTLSLSEEVVVRWDNLPLPPARGCCGGGTGGAMVGSSVNKGVYYGDEAEEYGS